MRSCGAFFRESRSDDAAPFGGARLRAWALVELGDSEAIDVFLREEDAERALEEALRDEPGWTGLLHVAAVTLDERDISPN